MMGRGVGGELKNVLILEWSFKQIDPPGNITHFLSICFWQEIWFKEITQIWHRVVWQIGSCLLSLVPKCLSLLIHTDWSLSCIHPKSESPWSPDSANYLNFPQNFSLRTQKLPTLLCWILSQIAKAWKMCQSVVRKCHKYLMNNVNMFLVSDSHTFQHSLTFLQHFWDFFNDLLTFVAKFWCRELRTFYAIFCDWKADSASFFAFRM